MTDSLPKTLRAGQAEFFRGGRKFTKCVDVFNYRSVDTSESDAFHIFDGHVIGSAIVELRGSGRRVIGHRRSPLNSSAVLEVSRYASCPERVIAGAGEQAGIAHTPLHHFPSERLGERLA